MQLVQLSGLRETNYLGKYLGVPLHGRNSRQEHYKFMIEQIHAKLMTWKGNILLFAGKLTLFKSVL